MKLISMTDFVLKIYKTKSAESGFYPIVRYAEFLKQPLELWMFVPCNKNGDVLEEPNIMDFKVGYGQIALESFEHYKANYQQAKERILFEGFEYVKKYEWGFKLKISFDEFEEYLDLINEDTIEDLLTLSVDFDWELTQTAIKQLGV